MTAPEPTPTAGKAEGWGNIGAIGGERREGFNDTGGASRFFYVAKADATERPRVNGTAHPTVKPLSLMRWLVRLVTPPGGTVLEPFAGSGTTVEACIIEGFQCIAADLLLARVRRPNRPRPVHNGRSRVMGQPTETIRTTALATTVSDATADAARRCIDRNVRDLPDRIEVAQALGLLPYVAHSRRADRTSGPRVERRPS